MTSKCFRLQLFLRGGARETDQETGPRGLPVLEPDETTVSSDNAVNQREPWSGALNGRLGCNEGFQHAIGDVRQKVLDTVPVLELEVQRRIN
jgi:hypothetical protein